MGALPEFGAAKALGWVHYQNLALLLSGTYSGNAPDFEPYLLPIHPC